MKPKMVLAIAAMVFASVALPMIVRAGEGHDVPVEWLDSLAAHRWHCSLDSSLAGYWRHRVMSMTAKDTTMEAMDRFERVTIGADGSKETELIDSLGNAIPDSLKEEKKDKDKKKKEKKAVGPLDAFLPAHRDNIHFSWTLGPGPNQVEIACETIKEKKGGFNGTVTVDTTTWLPVHSNGTPVPFPTSLVKEMSMDAQYAPWGDGYAFPTHVVTHVTAKMLFIKMNSVSTTDYSHFVGKK